MKKTLKKFAILCHRWMGVAFCVLFAFWFVSGIVMMYWDFPSVRPEDRLRRSAVLNAALVHLAAEEAYAKVAAKREPEQTQLVMYDGRPAYRFRAGREQSLVFADDGSVERTFDAPLRLRVAAQFCAKPANLATLEILNEEDQWTVPGSYKAHRPLSKFSWPDGEEVYVSSQTGEAVQRTTKASRFWAYLGAIPHWLYFTPLRKNQPLWSQVVIWLSGTGTIMALLGLIVGIFMYSPKRGLPYSGQKKLHTALGLFFGVVTCTWTFSGMMSMDPFPAASRTGPRGGSQVAMALQGKRPGLAAYSQWHPRMAIEAVSREFAVKSLELATFGAEPHYLLTAADGQTRIVTVRGEVRKAFGQDELLARLGELPIRETRIVTEYELYYIDRQSRRPLPALFVGLNDSEKSDYYIDPATGRVVQSLGERSRWNRWLYRGFHSMDLPILYKHRPAWDIVVLSLMLGGTALCVTSIVIAWLVLRRKYREFRRSRLASA